MASTETVDGAGAAVGVPVRLGKYTLLARLATGGMGEVYVAQMAGAAGFAKQVVIKRILPQFAQDEHFVNMFLDEARITAQLNHPNICQVFELGEVAGEYYIAMEYLEGLPLSNLLEKHAPGGIADLRIVAGLMIQACEGLAHAHEFSDPAQQIDGIVHRDISPQNLFVTTAGLIKVLDFGVAKLYREGSMTVTHSAKGKYLYMSPEQVQGEPVDRRSDIFALGVVLFEAITGRNLFRRSTEFQTLQAIISGDRARVAEYRSDVPQAMSDVVDRALSVSRSQRYASTRTLAEALTRAMAPLGGPASISELAEFVRREHSSDIAAQRDRIRRASAQMQAVDLAALGLLQDAEPSSEGRQRRTSASMVVPVPDDAEAPDAGASSAAGEAAAPAAGGADDAGEPMNLRRGRYARWGVLVGVALAVGALWAGTSLLGRQGQGASAPPVAAQPGAGPPAVVAPAVVVPAAAAPADTAPDEVSDTAPAENDENGATAGEEDEGGQPGGEATANASASTDGTEAAGEDAAGGGDEGADTASAAKSAEDERRRRRRDRQRTVRSNRSTHSRDQARGANDDDDDRSAGDDQKAKTGYFTIDSSPYAEIFVDGRKLGITPLVRIPLTAGRHSVRAVSANGAVERLSIRIQPGKTESRRIRFSDKRN